MEAQTVDHYIRLLDPYFFIYKEVKGVHKYSGKKYRIDLVIVHRQNPNFSFGVEVKRKDLESFNNYTKWLVQSVNYRDVLWGQNKKELPILIAPALSIEDHQVWNPPLKRIFGAFKIGEIHDIKDPKWGNKVRITMSDTNLWGSDYGFSALTHKMKMFKND